MPGKQTKVYIHQLVAGAFLGKRPKGCDTHHIDETRTNNVLTNLEYMEISRHRSHPGLVVGEKHGHAKLTSADVREIRGLRASGIRGTAVAKQFGVNKSLVSKIVHRKLWAQEPYQSCLESLSRVNQIATK